MNNILIIIITAAISFIVGVLVMFILAMRKRKKVTFPKILVSAVVAHGMVLTTLSYVLSFLDKEPVASVSETIVTEILAPTVAYIIGNVFLNVFEKNVTKVSHPISYLKDKEEVNG